MQCVGTSATLAGPGTPAEQRDEVAALATRLFGTAIPANNIVGESLRRATTGQTTAGDLRARLTTTPPAAHSALQSRPPGRVDRDRFSAYAKTPES